MKPIQNISKDPIAREGVQEASNPEFTEASERTNIASEESLSTIFGKIKKFFSDLKTVAFSGSYNDLSDKPTIPTVNNATLTIQKNGTNVQTFTANASSNVTCNIEVPTNTNQLTNGAGFITSSSNITGTSKNVTGTVAIANGGTGSTTRLGALQNLTSEDVGTSAQYFLTITQNWAKGGYTSVANAKTALGLKDLAYIAKGSDTTKYLRNDGSWVKPPNDNTTYSAGTGISLSGTTFSNSGVRAISTGSSNGTISVNTNGTSANVAVKGLGSAAYVNADTAASKSTIAQRDKNGYLQCVYLNTSNAAENINSYSGALVEFASTDGWLRKTSKANFQTYLGLGSLAYMNSLTYSDVGAAASSHTHSYLPLSGGTLTGHVKTDSLIYSTGTLKLQGQTYLNLLSPGIQCRNAGDSAWSGVSMGGATFKTGNSTAGSITCQSDGITYSEDRGNGFCIRADSGLWVRPRGTGLTFKPVNASAFTVGSSRRYKENIEPLSEEEAKKILNIETVTFDYKEKEGADDRSVYDQRGVIAEQVEDIIPFVVTLGKVDDEYVPDRVDYSKFVPYLIKMCQIQQEEIDNLKEEVSELKKTIQNI